MVEVVVGYGWSSILGRKEREGSRDTGLVVTIVARLNQYESEVVNYSSRPFCLATPGSTQQLKLAKNLTIITKDGCGTTVLTGLDFLWEITSYSDISRYCLLSRGKPG